MKTLPAIILAAALAGCAYQPAMPPPPLDEGMDTATLTTYYGSPARINRSNVGPEQWIFRRGCLVGPIFQENLYVYVEDGHVVGWTEYGCSGR